MHRQKKLRKQSNRLKAQYCLLLLHSKRALKLKRSITLKMKVKMETRPLMDREMTTCQMRSRTQMMIKVTQVTTEMRLTITSHINNMKRIWMKLMKMMTLTATKKIMTMGMRRMKNTI